jgi:hypothetical protein
MRGERLHFFSSLSALWKETYKEARHDLVVADKMFSFMCLKNED